MHGTRGPGQIAQTLTQLTDEIATAAESAGGTAPPVMERSPHIVGLQLPAGEPERARNLLRELKIMVGIRGTALRISPYVHNDMGDIHRLMDAPKQVHSGA